jgi:hypothetical protein
MAWYSGRCSDVIIVWYAAAGRLLADVMRNLHLYICTAHGIHGGPSSHVDLSFIDIAVTIDHATERARQAGVAPSYGFGAVSRPVNARGAEERCGLCGDCSSAVLLEGRG